MSAKHEGERPPPVLGRDESETLLAKPDEPAGMVTRQRGRHDKVPALYSRRRRGGRILERLTDSRSFPFLRLFAYYALLIALMAVLVYFVPAVRQAFLSPVALPFQEGGELMAGPTGDYGGRISLREALLRAVSTLLVIAGALTLVIPVAWVYMLTKRFRYDPALVSSVIILPIVVAGIALVVKNSIALAFALAGIVAAVRFRNTLKDPRDAVYIFLTIAIGLSAGVQALDVALVMSLAFNVVVLVVWHYNIGSIYSGRYARTGILSVGDSTLLVAQEPRDQHDMRLRMLSHADTIKPDGILLVHSSHPDLARHTVQEALADMARDWELVEVVPRPDPGGEDLPANLHTLEYLVRLKSSSSPPELVGALDERWGAQVAAAEYLPFRGRRKKRKKP